MEELTGGEDMTKIERLLNLLEHDPRPSGMMIAYAAQQAKDELAVAAIAYRRPRLRMEDIDASIARWKELWGEKIDEGNLLDIVRNHLSLQGDHDGT